MARPARRSLPTLLILAACAYLFALGARLNHPAPLLSAELLGMAVQSEDTDTDDDAMSPPGAIHFESSLDIGAVDLQASPDLSYRPEVARFVATDEQACSRLAVQRLFRPPRTLPV